MKKTISIVCLLALAVSCLFVFASCGAPNSNPDEALAALKENGITWAAKGYNYSSYRLKACRC